MKLQARHVYGLIQIATGLILVWLSYQWTEAREQAEKAVKMLEFSQAQMDACFNRAEDAKQDFDQCIRVSNQCLDELNECTKTNTACFNFFTSAKRPVPCSE